jgi:hypothetical protein
MRARTRATPSISVVWECVGARLRPQKLVEQYHLVTSRVWRTGERMFANRVERDSGFIVPIAVVADLGKARVSIRRRLLECATAIRAARRLTARNTLSILLPVPSDAAARFLEVPADLVRAASRLGMTITVIACRSQTECGTRKGVRAK